MIGLLLWAPFLVQVLNHNIWKYVGGRNEEKSKNSQEEGQMLEISCGDLTYR